MATNPLRIAYRDAIKRADWLDWAFGHYLGSAQHPRGDILTHYRHARREMRTVLRERRAQMLADAADVLAGLRQLLLGTAREAMGASAEQGRESAMVQLGAFLEDGVQFNPARAAIDVTPQVQAVLSDYDHQRSLILSIAQGGGDVVTEITGDDRRVGLMTPAGLISTATRAIGDAVGNGFASYAGRDRAEGFGWMKQPIPNIDSRTTETCLRVAGQKQLFDDKFKLTGEPRFADEMDWSPFHWYCRTSVVLYLPDYDDGLTARLTGRAKAERERREEESE